MLSPDRLATAYERYVVARRRGEPAAGPFEAWLEAHWMGGAAPEPPDPPAAVSLLGGVDAIRWYADGEAIVGYAVGRPRGCYWVPRSSAGPGLPPA